MIRVDDQTARATGHVTARGGYEFTSGPATVVDIDFIIHARRPKPTGIQPAADIEQMLVTKRDLSVCYRTVDGCPEIYEPFKLPSPKPEDSQWFENNASSPNLSKNIFLVPHKVFTSH